MTHNDVVRSRRFRQLVTWKVSPRQLDVSKYPISPQLGVNKINDLAPAEGASGEVFRTLHLRRARYIGLAKVHLQHVLTAAALNLVRVAAWLAGHPFARTRQSAFVRLMAHPA